MTQQHQHQHQHGPGPAPTYDVAIIGGGAAGLSGALALGRSRRKVVVIDAGEPRNAPADAVHTFYTREGTPPAELTRIGREQLAPFDVTLLDGRVTGAEGAVDAFTLRLTDGFPVTARRLLVTTGLVDELPAIPGVRERWGRDVIACPYCHGWEVRDQPIAVLGVAAMSAHQALLFRQLSADVTYFSHLTPLTPDQAEQLIACGITVVTGAVESLVVEDDRIRGVRLGDGTVVGRAVVVVGGRMVARLDGLAALGLTPAAHPSGVGDHLPSDLRGQTSVPGIWAAGNVTDPSAQVVVAASQGLMAGAMINADLVLADAAAAVANAREAQQMWSAEFWDDRYASADRIWSGNPNQRLVEQVADLPAGRALDVGCGEGADALWLAARGWQVTAVDVSQVALDRAAAHAATAGVGDEIGWTQVDILSWVPPEKTFDLVSVQFMHLPGDVRSVVNARLAAAVRPGGSLLIVGHDFSDTQTSIRRPHLPDLFYSATEIAAALDPADWRVAYAGTPERTVTGPDGDLVTIKDAVLHAVRLG